MKKVFILPLLCLLTFVCSSCSDKEYITEVPPNELRPEITVIFTSNGLGDLGYNDLVLQGFQTIYQNNLFIKMYLYAPHSIQEAEGYIYGLDSAFHLAKKSLYFGHI